MQKEWEEEMIYYAIKRLDNGLYFSNFYNWQKQLRKALFYVNEKRAIEMAERQDVPCKIVKIKIEEVEE